MKVRVCVSCGKYNPENEWYCKRCGDALSVDSIIDVDDSIADTETPKMPEEPDISRFPTEGNSVESNHATESNLTPDRRKVEKWKCMNCGGINPTNQEYCLGCNISVDENYKIIQQQETKHFQDLQSTVEKVRSQIKSLSPQVIGKTWEYAILTTGSFREEGDSIGSVLFLNNGMYIEFPSETFAFVIAELGLNGWDMVNTLSTSENDLEVKIKDIRPLSHYMIAALLNTYPLQPMFSHETVRNVTSIMFIFKRQLTNE